ncbi:hypothetical protein HanIR_Chr08g0344141 [Helianthus annuus]|uniref:uncharacterized protein LOC110870707 n=1 Tax=Helianthus annuus TaxID=4232 RepID=UPI000B8F166F|nr:uncharacterized protein LOC110870707 [Helianthus annuus]KAJ0544947.1 hypothetical protein HanIR_Chr08g0344141 [Helianthus annuus]
MGLVSISIRTHFLAFNAFPSDVPHPLPHATMTSHRRRVLVTFATLITAIVQKILKRMHIPTTPIGEKAKILYVIEHNLLAILSFFDDHIMVIENLTENVFPSSTRVFDKIDDMVKASECLPKKLDEFFDNDVPTFIQRVPFLNRVIKKDDKEIVIDITCHGYREEQENSFEYENVAKPDLKEETSSKDDSTNTSKPVGNSSLKDVIDDMNKENETMEDANGEFLYSARANSSADDIHQSEDQDQEDPIFDLFEAGWHMSPRAISTSSVSMKSPDRVM